MRQLWGIGLSPGTKYVYRQLDAEFVDGYGREARYLWRFCYERQFSLLVPLAVIDSKEQLLYSDELKSVFSPNLEQSGQSSITRNIARS